MSENSLNSHRITYHTFNHSLYTIPRLSIRWMFGGNREQLYTTPTYFIRRCVNFFVDFPRNFDFFTYFSWQLTNFQRLIVNFVTFHHQIRVYAIYCVPDRNYFLSTVLVTKSVLPREATDENQYRLRVRLKFSFGRGVRHRSYYAVLFFSTSAVCAC